MNSVLRAEGSFIGSRIDEAPSLQVAMTGSNKRLSQS